jgi:hypothetical protein
MVCKAHHREGPEWKGVNPLWSMMPVYAQALDSKVKALCAEVKALLSEV